MNVDEEAAMLAAKGKADCLTMACEKLEVCQAAFMWNAAKDWMAQEKLTHTYCGDCGHRYPNHFDTCRRIA